MIKPLSIIVILMMIVHLIRPFGLPGLKRRGDVWKLAVGFIIVMMITVFMRPE